MQIGLCLSPNNFPPVSGGCDYIELNVQGDLIPLESDGNFAAKLEEIKSCAVPAKAANLFMPGDIKTTGPDVDPAKQRVYSVSAFKRAKLAGIETIAFGSGGSRQIPDNFNHDEAYKQLLEFGKMIAPLAQEQGVTVAVEPLCYKDCNIINTVKEGAKYVREVNHPNFRLLVDSYHWGLNGESAQDIIDAGDLIAHVHTASYPNRLAPGCDDCDLTEFFEALKEIGYDGRISLECDWEDIDKELATGIPAIKKLWG